ncbi:iron-sulfur cluster repair di-iron protein [Pedobacter sp. BS3]|uniref:iron-sulfur cluster repair di-iron protein n=1 Tax=Pedobacter sp. BS3 TaxID=2567937 RepID=UPI0011EE86DB|nr:iron-sulfur cluster repair di-iron protein [Pedobacter sp. BS3]TZF84038.1 iron-sulfur cluster repair di-iron protein [Pedobacter sp. BS3]
MENLAQKTVGAIVADNYKTASVFQKYHIDFCCNGDRTLDEACKAENVDTRLLEREIASALEGSPENYSGYNTWSLDFLADFIQKKYHGGIRERSPEITAYLDKICKVHGQRHPELKDIYHLFSESVAELNMHMKKEEVMLFPFIRKMVQAKNEQSELVLPMFGTVRNPVQMMMIEHNQEGERFRQIAGLSNNYTPADDACSTYKVAFEALKTFEEDLHVHIHLENNILFPKSILLEQEFNA